MSEAALRAALESPDDPCPHDTQVEHTWQRRIAEVVYEVDDIIECIENVIEEDPEEHPRVNWVEDVLGKPLNIRAILHKLQESRGPLMASLTAARQHDMTQAELDEALGKEVRPT